MIVNTIGYSILGIPPYFFYSGIGLVISFTVYLYLMSKKRYPSKSCLIIIFFSLISMLAIARFFGCLTGIYSAIGEDKTIDFDTIFNTGIVFYGGLLGLLIGYFISIKLLRINDSDYYILNTFSVIIPLFHSVTRVGCFFAGCCYGKEMECFWAVEYTVLIDGIADTTYRIPIQLVESFYNFVLFIMLLTIFRRKQNNICLIIYYLLFYSVGRFVIEFFRGDAVRGLIMGISFSQMISIIIWVSLIVFKIKKYRGIKGEK